MNNFGITFQKYLKFPVNFVNNILGEISSRKAGDLIWKKIPSKKNITIPQAAIAMQQLDIFGPMSLGPNAISRILKNRIEFGDFMKKKVGVPRGFSYVKDYSRV